jgi:membrane protease YdiL (CAAX protease family)
LGLTFVVGIYLGVTAGLIALGYALEIPALLQETQSADPVAFGLSRTTVALMLSTFVGVPLGLAVILPLLHKRGIQSLFGPARSARRDFLVAAGVFLVINMAIALPSLWFTETLPHEPLAMVLLFLPLAALLVLLQTGAEEILFRGYIMQQLATRFQSPWIWAVLPSVLFGALHYDPALGQTSAVLIALSITLTGLLWADLTRLTGNLGAAMGWHFANNLVFMNFVGFDDYLNGFAWRILPFGYGDAPLSFFVIDPILSLTTWAILRRLLRARP